MRIELWTDGSCYPNPGGPGGWCAIIIARADSVEDDELMGPLEILANTPQMKDSYIKKKEPPLTWKARLLKGGAPPAEANTNNRMELRAIIEGFRAMTPCAVTVLTDSQYAIGLLSRRNRVKKNRDMLSEFLAVSQGFRITWKHIPGHGSGNPNVIADLVAGSEANEHRAGTESQAG